MIPDYVFNYFINFMFNDLRDFFHEFVIYADIDFWDIMIFSAVMIAFASSLFRFDRGD